MMVWITFIIACIAFICGFLTGLSWHARNENEKIQGTRNDGHGRGNGI